MSQVNFHRRPVLATGSQEQAAAPFLDDQHNGRACVERVEILPTASQQGIQLYTVSGNSRLDNSIGRRALVYLRQASKGVACRGSHYKGPFPLLLWVRVRGLTGHSSGKTFSRRVSVDQLAVLPT